MNKAILIGRLVRDGELRFIPNSGQAVWNSTIAVDRGLSKDKKAELQAKGQPTADFIRVIAWGKTAEACANYTAKGSLLAVEGSIQTSTYKTAAGETRYATDVKAEHIEFLSRANEGSAQGDGASTAYNPDDFRAIEDDEDIPFIDGWVGGLVNGGQI